MGSLLLYARQGGYKKFKLAAQWKNLSDCCAWLLLKKEKLREESSLTTVRKCRLQHGRRRDEPAPGNMDQLSPDPRQYGPALLLVVGEISCVTLGYLLDTFYPKSECSERDYSSQKGRGKKTNSEAVPDFGPTPEVSTFARPNRAIVCPGVQRFPTKGKIGYQLT